VLASAGWKLSAGGHWTLQERGAAASVRYSNNPCANDGLASKARPLVAGSIRTCGLGIFRETVLTTP